MYFSYRHVRRRHGDCRPRHYRVDSALLRVSPVCVLLSPVRPLSAHNCALSRISAGDSRPRIKHDNAPSICLQYSRSTSTRGRNREPGMSATRERDGARRRQLRVTTALDSLAVSAARRRGGNNDGGGGGGGGKEQRDRRKILVEYCGAFPRRFRAAAGAPTGEERRVREAGRRARDI